MDDTKTLYNKIKKYPEAKAEADAFAHSLGEKYTEKNPAPDEVVQKGLEGILAKYQPKTKNPVAASSASDNQRLVYAAGLAGIALLLGMPYI
jgi:hypothetical protein